MNHYTKSIWVLTLGMAALVIAFLSPLLEFSLELQRLFWGRRPCRRQNLKWHMLDSG